MTAGSSCTFRRWVAARVQGDWTRALNEYALEEQARLGGGSESEKSEKAANAAPLVQVMMDGAYGGCSVDLGEYESVLLVAGGSGATFTLGLLDDIVARCVKLGRPHGEKTRRIEFAWCVRSYGKHPLSPSPSAFLLSSRPMLTPPHPPS